MGACDGAAGEAGHVDLFRRVHIGGGGPLVSSAVTTHWLFSERLATAYPSIQVDSNLLFARDKLFAEAQKHPAAKKTATESCQFESTQ
jgi:hypothetical protein